MRQRINKQKKSRFLIIATVAAMLAAGHVAFPSAAHATGNMPDDSHRAMTQSATQYYSAQVRSLNQSHVSGEANFILENRTLTATINLSGLEPGVHPQHIHGQAEAEAECPTRAADINHDNFISVLEGAPAYGPIKLNLTSPQTPFGTPPTSALFTPFAGTPDNKNFPTAGADGNLHFTQTYHFDNSSAAQGAFDSVKKLDFQHYVVHGGTAPASVDAPAFAALGAPRVPGYDQNQKVYDVLLPVGCGVIEQDHDNNDHDTGSVSHMPIPGPTADEINSNISATQAQLNLELHTAGQVASATGFTTLSNQQIEAFRNQINNITTQYSNKMQHGMNKDEARNQLVNSVASTKDHLINELNNNRNQEIDMLNQAGNVTIRDGFLTAFDKAVANFSISMEHIKNSL